MENRTCIITGASSGIGKVTATSVAQQGAKLVMVCRSKEKGLIVLNEIIEKTRNPDTRVL
jgi:short-subunit dehydrogenase